MNTTTVIAQTLRFARRSLLAVGLTAALAGSIAPVAAESFRDLVPAGQPVTTITIDRPDFSLAQPNPVSGAEFDLIDRLPNELPDRRRAPFRFGHGIEFEIGSDLVGSCIGLCTGQPADAGGGR